MVTAVSGPGDALGVSPLSSARSLGVIVTVTCRSTPGLAELADRRTDPLPHALQLIQSIDAGSIGSDVRRSGSEPARGLQRDRQIMTSARDSPEPPRVS